MKALTLDEISRAIDTISCNISSNAQIKGVEVDSRQIRLGDQTIFFALKGALTDGHKYLSQCIKAGVKTFVISDPFCLAELDGCNVYIVEDTLVAIQQLATYYRNLFDIPVIAITGSNGKTIVKEWLAQVMGSTYHVAKSPGSYNSQLGVPLSIFTIEEDDDLAIFEAGISTTNEMEVLANIIRPTHGIFTNIGSAHDAGFQSREEKIIEKLKLFKNAETLIISDKYPAIIQHASNLYPNLIQKLWGHKNNGLKLVHLSKNANEAFIALESNNHQFTIHTQLTDDSSIENLLHVVATSLVFGIAYDKIVKGIESIEGIPMRMEMIQGPQNMLIINDSYSHDLTSLAIACGYLSEQKGNRQSLAILSDLMQHKSNVTETLTEIKNILKSNAIDQVWWIGHQGKGIADRTFHTKEELVAVLNETDLQDHAILVKGARQFKLETIVDHLTAQKHSCLLKVDLKALDHNIQTYSNLLDKKTKIIAVVKAGAYGSGVVALARLLAHKKVAALAVAFADEGVVLRQAGIDLPIMVLNPERRSLNILIEYQFEAEVYDLTLLQELVAMSKECALPPIHIKLDTGMHRLGFLPEEISQVGDMIIGSSLKVGSIFTHLAGSEDAHSDEFSHQQASLFNEMYNRLTSKIGYHPDRHILNTGGIVRFSQYHYERVRLGLGMYGIDSTGLMDHQLEKVHTFEAGVIQVKQVTKGESIGYNQAWRLDKDTTIAIINIGYAGGLPRNAGMGRHSVYINGCEALIIGKVCMDLTIIDVSKVPNVTVGDRVEIYGPNHPIEALAKATDTIPYEILSRVSARVRKVYLK